MRGAHFQAFHSNYEPFYMPTEKAQAWWQLHCNYNESDTKKKKTSKKKGSIVAKYPFSSS